MEERRPLDGRFMSRLTRLRLLSRRWQHHAFTTPSGREKEGEGRGLHLSRCHIALMQDLDRSRGWSTISWLNRLINGSRGGSRPICITLAPPSSLEPVQRHRINPLRLFLRGTIYLSYGERCSLSAWEWSLSLVAWFNNNSWNDLFHLAIISSRRDNRSSRFNYFSMFKSRNCIFKLLHIASMYSVSIYQIISKVESLFKNFVHSSLRIIRKIYFCSSKTYIYISV